MSVRRFGRFLQVEDADGCRHLLRLTSVQALSDTDLMRNETFITAAGRTIRVPQALDEILPLVAPGAGTVDRRRASEAEPWPF